MRVLVALSGGVDSSVAAAELVEQGHEVVAATMKLWGGESDTGCCSVGDVEDARRSAAQLGIDHHVFNYTEEFDRHVVAPYAADHAAGLTPNPCVECNRHLKFDLFMRRADLLGFDAIATGHHARIGRGAGGSLRIRRGADAAKDQSYVLHPLLDGPLERVLFPIGHLEKSEVRERAARLGLRTAAKPDSQDVCFITRRDGRRSFLAERIELHPGQVLDTEGGSVGSVDAVELVTIGQRRGLDLAGGGSRRFVTSVDVEGRVVTVGSEADLLVGHVTIGDVRLAHGIDPACIDGKDLAAQTSAHGAAQPARLSFHGAEPGTTVVRWRAPHRAVAPGQSVVVYDGDEVVASGVVSGT